MAQLNDLIVTGAARFLNTVNGKITNAATADNGISTITRSGTNFTVTRADGSTTSFTQQDTNTTYSLSTLGIGNVKNYDQSKAIKTITRNGLTFTATALDGTTSSFTQQDTNTTYANMTSAAAGLAPAGGSGTTKYLRQDGSWQVPPDTNTTYTANNGVGISGNTFYNSGVRAISQGTANGTINVNTNGSTADVSVKGLAALAYKASLGKADVGLGNVANVDQSKAIKTITRSGVTFTATALDNTTFSFTQQDSNTTYANMTSATAGLAPAGGSGTTKYLRQDGSWQVPPDNNTTYGNMTSAAAGLAPAGGSGTTKYLRQDGSWQVPPDNNTTYGNATSTTAGLIKLGGGTTNYLRADGSWTAPPNTTYGNMTSATAGLAPAGGSGTTKYLRQDGSWQVPPDTNTTYSLSTLGIGNVKNYDQSKAIKTITRNGLTFTATALDGTTSSFTQQDTNTTYSLSTLGIGNVKNYDQSKAIKSITRNGLTFTATALDGTTSSFTQQDTNTTYSFSNNASTLAWGGASTIGTVGGTALTVKMPVFPGYLATTATYTAGTGLSKSGTAFSINANASTCTTSYYPAVSCDFDFGELTSNGETYTH